MHNVTFDLLSSFIRHCKHLIEPIVPNSVV